MTTQQKRPSSKQEAKQEAKQRTRQAPKLVRRTASGDLPGFTPLLSRLFAARGITDAAEMDLSLQGLLAPDALAGLRAAADLVADAMQQDERLLILGDFDADGATAAALLVSGLSEMGCAAVDYLVPDRFAFGYGMTPEIVKVATESEKPDLIITVDNGISSIEGVAFANSLGIKVVITDHHLPGERLPEAAAIVNPNQPGCEFASKNLAGVGVAFYLLMAVRSRLRERGWFDDRTEPSLACHLDLVALGTIADVVTLDQNNRRLVNEGIKRIRSGAARPGLMALLEVAGIDHRYLCSRDLAFSIAPRLNAAGRLSDMTIGIDCLLAEGNRAKELARQLHDINNQRKEIEQQMRQQAEGHVAELDLHGEQDGGQGIGKTGQHVGLCLFDASWHQGVVGIIASRISRMTARPVIAFANAGANGGQDELKGSARSVPGFHIRDALDAVAARHPGLIAKFGGHAMAAGLSLQADQLEAFRTAFDEEAKRNLTSEQLESVLVTDGEVGQPITLELAWELAQAAPWGQGFPEPLFDGEFRVLEQRIVGERHLKLLLDSDGQSLDAIFFNHPRLLEGSRLKCAYRIQVNQYRGRFTPQLVVEAAF